jgi:hypothetical protein
MIAIAIVAGMGLTGCEWFNKNVLGKSDKENSEGNTVEIDDSIRQAERIKYLEMKAKEQEQSHNQMSKPYHIIVGAFEEKPNADNMLNLFKSNGYNPITFDYGGLTHVSAVSFDTLQEAEAALQNMLNLSYCPEDAWIFKK